MANNNDTPRRGGIWSFYFLVLLVLVGCGGGGSDAPPPRVSAAQSVEAADAATYFPLTEGNGWVYQVTLTAGAADPVRYMNHVHVANTGSMGGAPALAIMESNPDGDDTPALHYLQSTAEGIWRIDNADAADLLAAVPASYLELPFPLHFGSTSRQIDETNVDSGRALAGDGVHDMMDIVAEVTVIGSGTAAVPAGRFANCVVQQRLTLTTHASKTGAAATRQLRRTQWFARYWGPVRRETAVDGRTVIEELTAVNRTLAERSGDTAIYNTAVASVGGELTVAWTHGERPAELHLMKSAGAAPVLLRSFGVPSVMGTGGEVSLAAGLGRVHVTVDDDTQATAVYTTIDETGHDVRVPLWADGAKVSRASVAVDASGRTYIAGNYIRRDGGIDMRTLGLYTVDERDRRISGPQMLASISHTDRSAVFPSITTATNHVYILWEDTAHSLLASHDGGRSFAAGVRLDSRAAHSSARSDAAEARGNVNAVTSDGTSPATLTLHTSTNFGASFAHAELPTGGTDAVGEPQVALLGDTLYVAFLRGEMGANADLYVLVSNDGGLTFAPPLNVSGVARGEYVRQFSLASNDGDGIYLTWVTNNSGRLLLSELRHEPR